jgi:hypothetical protein
MVQTTAHFKQKMTPQEDALLLDAEGTQMKDRPEAEIPCHRCGCAEETPEFSEVGRCCNRLGGETKPACEQDYQRLGWDQQIL